MNTKTIIGIIVIVVIAVVLTTVGGKKSEKQIIKIGVIAPLTGPGAVFGNSLVKGVELAQEDLETRDTKYSYEILIQDDGTNPGTSASAAQKLVNVDKVRAIIAATSGTGNAIVPIADSAKVVHICVVCADKTIGRAPYNFTSSVLPDDEAEAWLTEAMRRGAKSIGLITQIHPGINAVADAIEKAAPAKNLPIVYKERYDGNNRDFKTIVSKAKQSNADVFFLMAFPPSIDIIGKELQALGVTNITGGAGALSIAAEPSTFNGDWYTEVPLADKAFVERFEKSFPDIRFNIRTAPFGYDSLMMLVDAFEKGIAPEEYIASLESYDGKAGHIIRTDNNLRSTPSIWEIQDGKPVPLEVK